MRRYIGTADHMENAGLSVPLPANHGYGRRHIIPEDHLVGDAIDPADLRLHQGKGRKLIVPFDHLKSDVLKPVSDITPVKVPTTDDMKGAIKDWLLTVHNMYVFSEKQWDTEVSVQPKGCHWVIEALTQQKKSIGREGPTARVIAEKMSMMPGSDLHHFGIRFAGYNDPKIERHAKHTPFPDNRSLVSPGVQDALHRGNKGQPQTTSCNRKHPEGVQRRYISSGQDHWKHTNIIGGDLPGTHGHAKDDDFSDGGLEHGVGHGKRFIGTKDHLIGGGTVAEQ